MKSPNYDKLKALIDRRSPHWGEILYTLDNWDDTKTEMENITNTSTQYGYKDTTGVTCGARMSAALQNCNLPSSIADLKEMIK